MKGTMSDYRAELKHAEKMRRKEERLHGLRALLQEYEDRGIFARHNSYVEGLCKRIATTQSQLKAMAGSYEIQ